MLIKCTKCQKTVIANKVVTFTSTLGTKKTVVPDRCWTTGNCKEKPVDEKK